MEAALKLTWNLEYAGPLAAGQQFRIIGAVPDGASEEDIKREVDRMDRHFMRLRERHEIPAMEEKLSQTEHALEQAITQKAELEAQLASMPERKRTTAPTNLINGLKTLEKNIPQLRENLVLIREMIDERKVKTAEVT